jgi:hypothetical protein
MSDSQSPDFLQPESDETGMPDFLEPESDESGEYEPVFEHKVPFDDDECERLQLKTWARDGLAYRNTRTGYDVLDTSKLNAKVLRVLRNCVVRENTEDELRQNSVTKAELYRRVLPNAPRASTDESPEQRKARENVMHTIWDVAKPNNGYVQRQLAGSSLVLVEAPVSRNITGNPTVGDEGEPATPMGRFLCDVDELIMTNSFNPRATKFVNGAKPFEANNAMITARRPWMRMQIAQGTAQAIRRAAAALPSGDVKAAQALTAKAATDEAANAKSITDEAATA